MGIPIEWYMQQGGGVGAVVERRRVARVEENGQLARRLRFRHDNPREARDSRRAGQVGLTDGRARTAGISQGWSLEASWGVDVVAAHAEEEIVESGDGRFWIFKDEARGGAVTRIVDLEHRTVIQLGESGPGVEVGQGEHVTCVDCSVRPGADGVSNVLHVVAGTTQRLVHLAFDMDGRPLQQTVTALAGDPAGAVHAGLLPEFVVFAGAASGKVYAQDCAAGAGASVREIASLGALQGPGLHTCIGFPAFAALGRASTDLYYIPDVLAGPADVRVLPLLLKDCEVVTSLKFADDRQHLVVSTNQRYLTIPLREAGTGEALFLDDTFTVLSKTSTNERNYTLAANDKYIAATSQFLYGLNLEIYGKSEVSGHWYSLGFVDIKALFHVNKVRKVQLLRSSLNDGFDVYILNENYSLQVFKVLDRDL